MLNIFVLEDTPAQQGRIEQAIYLAKEALGFKPKLLEIFGKPSQLLDAIKERGQHQLFFLDIEIKDQVQKGLEVAQIIRKQDPNAVIVFVTTHSEFLPLTYRFKVAALDFIDKGLSEVDFQRAVFEVFDHVLATQMDKASSDTFVFQTDRAHIQVPFHEILYFETSPSSHKIVLRTLSERLEFYGKLSQIVQTDERLYQSHRAYVVNPANIRRVDRKNHLIYFADEETCLVSRLKLKGLIDRLTDGGS